jgi:hypothetical protein
MMPDYRIYKIDSNRIAGPADVVTCDNDQQAINKAK